MSAPNLLIIMSDEHDPRYMGASGDTFVKTPNLDRLAAGGTRFSNAYTNCPICVPARAAFATGAYVNDIGYWDNAIAYEGAYKGWGHVLQAHGIRSESIGKLHYRSERDDTGFDAEHLAMHVYQGVGMVWGSIRDPMLTEPPHGGRMLGPTIGAGESTYTRYDNDVTVRTCEWLADAAGREKPWCLYVGLVAPHFPFIVAQEFLDLYPLDELPPRKLLPSAGYQRHPWVQAQHDFWPNDDLFADETEKRTAMAAYLALTSWMDHNVGRILGQLDATGLADSTRVIYTSDHGDNVGHRGLWGKSNFYQESACVPMIISGSDVPVATKETPVSLIDIHSTVLQNFGLSVDDPVLDDGVRRPGASLLEMLSADVEPERVAFSEYHAVGSPTGGFMVRKGRWKYHHYEGFEPELFDLEADPEELVDLARQPGHEAVIAEMHEALLQICDPAAVDQAAKARQAALIEHHSGREAAKHVGAPAATPVPGQGKPKFGQ